MTPQDELDAAELNRDQQNYFIGWIARSLDRKGVITGRDWANAIDYAKGVQS